MFGRLAANQGFNKFMATAKSFMGWGAIRGAGRHMRTAWQSAGTWRGTGYQNPSFIKQQMMGSLGQAGSRGLGWATASGFQGGKRAGAIAARMGGPIVGGAAAADFLNPWGLGWGD